MFDPWPALSGVLGLGFILHSDLEMIASWPGELIHVVLQGHL